MTGERGTIACFTTYRPAVALDIYSCPVPNPPLTTATTAKQDEHHMTDGDSYNHNGQIIPEATVKTIVQHLKKVSKLSPQEAAHVDSGMVFVSERGGLETLHIALYVNVKVVKIFGFSEVFGTFSGARMEDNGRVAGDCLVYVTTKDDPGARRQPWTAVYKTNLITCKTDRLTPRGEADLSPSVSPSGKKVAVASFQSKGGWKGEIEDLMTDIYVMDVDNPLDRKLVVKNGGWPSWGSEEVIFFHRKVQGYWRVYQANISDGVTTWETPKTIHAMTPAAISATSVAVATIRPKPKSGDKGKEAESSEEAEYRHIEIFDTAKGSTIQITQNIRPERDHFNPFVIDSGKRIGYHRCIDKSGDLTRGQLDKIISPKEDIGLFRVSGTFPTFSRDGSKLAFVDNEFRSVFVWVHGMKEPRQVYEMEVDKIFLPVWSQDLKQDTLYVCVGPSFKAGKELDICEITNVSKGGQHRRQLTRGFNNAFPSTNRDGTKLVFRSTRDGGKENYKNLYIMDLQSQSKKDNIKRLTTGPYFDTHCQWSPSEYNDWIVFSSTRDKSETAQKLDNGLDPGHFGVYLVKASSSSPVIIKVITTGDIRGGHVNHPFFSPDGRSLVVTSDLAAVSADPISLPRFLHSVRPYGDVFTVDIEEYSIQRNKDLKKFHRITHSRYENFAASWTKFSDSSVLESFIKRSQQ